MTITVDAKTREILPRSVLRKAGFRTGDRLEVRASGGIVSLIPAVPSADDEYTPAQRAVGDASLALAKEDIRKGRIVGPFGDGAEMVTALKAELKRRAAKKRAR
jgi:bifunctional DNA-binding transcriptional regulator/antitoxin component of YhaV-PrlF toxin-antitoxin module